MSNIVTWGEKFKEAYLFLLIKNAQFFFNRNAQARYYLAVLRH